MDWWEDFPQDHASVDWAISGLPGDLDVQQLLRDTEEKLKLNACSIEQSLKELQVKLGDSWTGDKPSTPTDCFHWFSPRNLTFLKPTCTGQQQLLDFLKALHPAAGSPVHAVREEAALEVQEVWEDVRLLLRRHLLDKLQTAVAADPDGGGSRPSASQRAQRLQQLLFLYPEAEVLSRYQSVRGGRRLPGGVPRPAPPGREDLRALSSLVEPAAALAFVNHAHLATVARELASLLEKLVENTVKDNSASGGKVRKCSAKSRVAVAPQEEPPRRGRSFCLTSHQLRQLTLLASVLLDLEERVEELAAHLGFLCCAGETPCSVRDCCRHGELVMSWAGILKKTRDDPEATLRESSKSAAETFPPVPEATALEFDWRSALRELAPPMAHCVKVVLEDVCARGLQQEEAAARASGSALLALADAPRWRVPRAPPGERAPKMIAKFPRYGERLPPSTASVLSSRPSPTAAGPARFLRVYFSAVTGGVPARVIPRYGWSRVSVPEIDDTSLGDGGRGSAESLEV
ncbi:hypothetical protein ANANG_G00195740 [Anguilla anguilla]|uniref:Uncharacterized protein n=1 Tax=Anguilla anguilla TaxID=7936 RepID=A0A9D3M5B4_ANGAN|nr:hypothetical protein ANANG_G00195740 [Anguilla anguilla]